MKSLIVIPLTVAAVFGIAAAALSLAAISVHPADVIIAGIIASASGMMGLLPVLRTGRRDPVSIAQMALVGTMLHLLTQTALAICIIASHAADRHGAFPYWLLGGYWTSLAALIWQLRRIILAATNTAKISE